MAISGKGRLKDRGIHWNVPFLVISQWRNERSNVLFLFWKVHYNFIFAKTFNIKGRDFSSVRTFFLPKSLLEGTVVK